MAQAPVQNTAIGQAPQQGNGNGLGRFVPDALAKYFRDPSELAPKVPPQQNNQGQQPPGNGQQGQQGQQQQSSSGQQGANNSDPNSNQNPLDVYRNLFNNEPPLDKNGKPIVNEPPKFNLDAKTIGTAAEKIDFMSGLPQEVMDKLNSGQVDAQTLAAAMNHVGRNAYARAMEHATTLTDRFVGMRLSHEQQGLGQHVRRLLAQNQVLSNPNVAKNPAVREHMEIISDGLARKFPDASPDWIAEKTTEYFQHLASAVNPSFGQQSAPQQEHNPRSGELRSPDGKVFDWGSYLTEQK